MSCTCKQKPCSCSDTPLNTSVLCPTPECTTPPQCSEVFSSDCVIYTGPSLLAQVSGIETIVVPTNIPMSSVVQYLLNYAQVQLIENAIFYLHSMAKSLTTISLAWNAYPGETSYNVYISPDTITPPTLLATTTDLSKVVTGLTANTPYLFFIEGVVTTKTSLLVSISTL